MDWNEILNNLLLVVVIPGLGALVTYGVRYLAKAAEAKAEETKNATIEKYTTMAADAVVTAVDYVAQTYVDSLKAAGTFTEEAQKQAFNEAKEKALQVLSAEAQEALTEIYGDFQAWLELKIEQTCRELKQFQVTAVAT